MPTQQSRAGAVYRAFAVLGVCIAAALPLGSCSGGHPTPTSNGVAFCQQWLEAIVGLEHRCSGASESALGLALPELDPCAPITASLTTGGLAFDAREADACLAETTALPCWETIRAATSCAKAYAGQVPAKGACHQLPLASSECAAGSWCKTSDQCPGTCVAYAKLGEPCGKGDAFCDSSLWCDYQTATCAVDPYPPIEIGEPCAAPGTCRAGLICEGKDGPVGLDPLHPETGTCLAPPASGPCYYNSDCSDHCVGADPPDTPGTCTPWKQIGQACTPGAHECVIDAYCGATSTCITLPVAGQPCPGNAGEGAECLDGFCDGTHTCRKFLPAGAQCYLAPGWFPPDPCGGALRQCDMGHCLPTCMAGQSCGGVGELCCAGELCDAGATCNLGKCTTCGEPGQPCCESCEEPYCENPPLYCPGGGCCDEDRICVAAGSECGGRAGTCQSQSCGGCGGPNEPCCASSGSGAPWCSSARHCECSGPKGSGTCMCTGLGAP